MSAAVECNVGAEEWWPVPIPEFGAALEDLNGVDWPVIDRAVIDRWIAAMREFRAASVALAEAGGWTDFTGDEWHGLHRLEKEQA